MAAANWLNLARIQARLEAIPEEAAQALREGLVEEVDEGLVPTIKRAMASQYETADHGHQSLIDSVHAYPNPDREISRFVLADAKDAEGKFIGANVEQGHKARNGAHVAGRPAFWPTWRAFKAGMAQRLKARAFDAIRRKWES